MPSNIEARTTGRVLVDAMSRASTRPTALSKSTSSSANVGSHAAKKSSSASSRDGKPSMIRSPTIPPVRVFWSCGTIRYGQTVKGVCVGMRFANKPTILKGDACMAGKSFSSQDTPKATCYAYDVLSAEGGSCFTLALYCAKVSRGGRTHIEHSVGKEDNRQRSRLGAGLQAVQGSANKAGDKTREWKGRDC